MLEQENDDLRVTVQTKNNNLSDRAKKLGMIHPDKVLFMDVKSGKIY
jgi:hypothetical protein